MINMSEFSTSLLTHPDRAFGLVIVQEPLKRWDRFYHKMYAMIDMCWAKKQL